MHLKIKTHKKNKNTSKCYRLILRKYFINQNTVTKMQGMNQVVKHNSVFCRDVKSTCKPPLARAIVNVWLECK